MRLNVREIAARFYGGWRLVIGHNEGGAWNLTGQSSQNHQIHNACLNSFCHPREGGEPAYITISIRHLERTTAIQSLSSPRGSLVGLPRRLNNLLAMTNRDWIAASDLEIFLAMTNRSYWVPLPAWESQ